MHRAMFEREHELRALDDALSDLAGGTGGVLAFAGAAGLGKTALLAEVRRRAVARGCTVLSARGGEQEQELPFHTVRQLVQPLLAAVGEDEHRRMLGSWYDIVAPAIGLVAPEGGGTPDPQGVRDGLDWVATCFAVRHRPVVMILDDAHWIDAESLAWVTAFAPRAEELPVLIAVAYRPDEHPYRTAPFHSLAVRHGSRPFDLMALTPQAVARLVRHALGPGADEPFCRECWAVTGGNPFEVGELTAKVAERRLEPRRENVAELRELASTIKGSGLVQRLERLGTAAVRLAWAAAVLGTEISPSLAAAVAGLGPEEAAGARARLHAARILAGGTEEGEPLRFFHPLIATAVYQAIPAALRVALHGQAAAVVTDAGQGPTAAARHLLEVHPDGDPDVVATLRAAAREYLRAGAPEAARRCLERALREPPDLEERASVLFELGCSASLTRPATTVNHLRAALEEPGLGPGLREAVTYRLAQALGHSGRMEEAAEVVAEEARRAATARTRLRMRAEQFMWNAFRADEPDSPARSRRLARLADHLTGRGMAERYVLGLRAWDAVVRGEPAATALRFAEEALGDGLSWTDENWGFEVPVMVAMTFMYCDQPGRAEELFAEGIAECERKGWRGSHLAFGFTLLGYIRYRRGRLTEAEGLVREGLRIADRVGSGAPAQLAAIGTLVETLLARGRVEEAWEVARRYDYGAAVPKAVVYPDAQAVHGELLLARGRRREAGRELAGAGGRLDPRGMRNPSWCPWQQHLALALRDTDPGRAATLAAEAVERARQFGTASAIGQALRCAAEATGGPDEEKLLREAVGYLEHSPASYELALALVGHGAALCRAGLPQEAADQLYRGLETAAHCGADALVERARAELTAAGLRPLELRYAESEDLGARERTAAEWAARGLTDPEVAREMGLREQAVTRLLSAVYRKLGTDRAGLARVLERR
ncbi:MAG TPA: AAA family ATPase [Streptomyces sp.]|uniref:ATP-binding protein n=1 Tax=Streptomyces sp. TaxID=1931 RepID=UPI002D349437|nr:AAA family ATPase [Streptomyces sp.]HZG06094.1 AAA family ATPase [Streptomyces sp.]